MNQPPAREVPPIVKVSEMLREDTVSEPDAPRDAVVRARELMADKESGWFMGESTRKVLTELADEVERLRVALGTIQHRCGCVVTNKECSQAVLDIDSMTRKALGNEIYGYHVGPAKETDHD